MLAHLPYIFTQLIQPMNIVLMVVGTFVGIIFGAIPGLSGTMAVTSRSIPRVKGSHARAQPRLKRVWALASCRAMTASRGPAGERSFTRWVNAGSRGRKMSAPVRLNSAWARRR